MLYQLRCTDVARSCADTGKQRGAVLRAYRDRHRVTWNNVDQRPTGLDILRHRCLVESVNETALAANVEDAVKVVFFSYDA